MNEDLSSKTESKEKSTKSLKDDYSRWLDIYDSKSTLEVAIEGAIGKMHADECLKLLKDMLFNATKAKCSPLEAITGMDEKKLEMVNRINEMISITPGFALHYLTEVCKTKENSLVVEHSLAIFAEQQDDEQNKALALSMRNNPEAFRALSKKAYEEYVEYSNFF